MLCISNISICIRMHNDADAYTNTFRIVLSLLNTNTDSGLLADTFQKVSRDVTRTAYGLWGMPNFMELPVWLSAASTRRRCIVSSVDAEGANLGGMSVPQGLQNLQNLPNLPASQWKRWCLDRSPWITVDHPGSHGPTSSITRHPRHYKAFKFQAIATWLSHPRLGLILASDFSWLFNVSGKAFKVFRVFKAGTWTLHALRHLELPAGPMLVPCGFYWQAFRIFNR